MTDKPRTLAQVELWVKRYRQGLLGSIPYAVAKYRDYLMGLYLKKQRKKGKK